MISPFIGIYSLIFREAFKVDIFYIDKMNKIYKKGLKIVKSNILRRDWLFLSLSKQKLKLYIKLIKTEKINSNSN